MTDELLPYYRRELAYLRTLAAEFAAAHPKIAERLQLGADKSRDPHTERLLEGVAYLTARVRHKLDDDFPELAEAVLNVVCPHYLRPIPSAAIAQFTLDDKQVELIHGHVIPPKTMLETEPIDGEPCRFRTCYPVQLWPLRIRDAAYRRSYGNFALPFLDKSKAVLRVELRTLGEQVPFSALTFASLRFYLNGPTQFTYDLYEQLVNQLEGIVLAAGDDDPAPVRLDKSQLRAVGFGRDECLLPISPRSMWGYQLLSEYFAFPDRFLFVDLHGFSPEVLSRFRRSLCIYFYLNRHVRDVERYTQADTLRLGCTPVINLFSHVAEPIELTQTQTEYRVSASERVPQAFEVYSVESVSAITAQQENVDYHPFFSMKHGQDEARPRTFWYATRRRATSAGGKTDNGTEVYLSLVDLDFQPRVSGDRTLQVETYCLNRDLPRALPFGGGQPRLQASMGGALFSVECLTAPTPTFRPPLRHGVVWRLVSQLSLNHLSLVEDANGADALRDLLRLYDFAELPENQRMIDGVLGIKGRRVVRRIPPDPEFDEGRGEPGFCRGLEIRLQLDETKFTGGSVFLFASVLERFLGLYCSLNSFTQLVATTNKPDPLLRLWPPRAGDRVLL